MNMNYLGASLFFVIPSIGLTMDPPPQAESEFQSLTGSLLADGSQLCKRHVFQNYFSFLPKDEALGLIEKSFNSILLRLKVPYVDPYTNQLKDIDFFKTLNKLLQAKAPGSKVYVTGGVIRNLLSYIYKKLYNEHHRLLDLNQDNPLTEKQFVDMDHDVFRRILSGQSRKGNSETTVSEEKELSSFKIGNDFEILVDFPDGYEGDKEQVLIELGNFINSAQTHLELDEGTGKGLAVTHNVKDYQKYFEKKGTEGIVFLPGTGIDWLAFPIPTASGEETHFHFPNAGANNNTMNLFLQGQVDYLPPVESKLNPDDQTIKGLRVLLELPFLKFTPKGAAVIDLELRDLIRKAGEGELSEGAYKQFEQLFNNARFAGANNRFINSIPCVSEGQINLLVQELSNKVGATTSGTRKPMPFLSEFLIRTKISNRTTDKGQLDAQGYLMGVDDFINKYTDNGILYHGTTQLKNVLSMIRNGLVPSSKKQGQANFGKGFYTAPKRSDTRLYSGNFDIVIPLRVKTNLPLRILEINSVMVKELFEVIEKENPGQDPIEILVRNYDLDIIISSANEVLIENFDAVVLPKNAEEIIMERVSWLEKDTQQKCEKGPLSYGDFRIFNNYRNYYFKMAKYLNPRLSPETIFSQFKACLTQNMDNYYSMAIRKQDSDMIKYLSAYMPKEKLAESLGINIEKIKMEIRSVCSERQPSLDDFDGWFPPRDLDQEFTKVLQSIDPTLSIVGLWEQVAQADLTNVLGELVRYQDTASVKRILDRIPKGLRVDWQGLIDTADGPMKTLLIEQTKSRGITLAQTN